MIVEMTPSSATLGLSTGLLVTSSSGSRLLSVSSLVGPREGGDWESVVISASSSASIGTAVTSDSGISVLLSWLTEGTVVSDSAFGVVTSLSPGWSVVVPSNIDLPSPSSRASSSTSVVGVVPSAFSVMSFSSSSSISASAFVVVVSPSSSSESTSTPAWTPASSGRLVASSTSDFTVVLLSMADFAVVVSELVSEPTMMVIVSDSESVVTVVTSVFGVVGSSTVSPSTSIAVVVESDSALTVVAASSSALVVSSLSSSDLAVVVMSSIGIMVVTIVTPSSVSSIDKMVVVIGAPVVTSSPGAAKSTSSDETEVSSESVPAH